MMTYGLRSYKVSNNNIKKLKKLIDYLYTLSYILKYSLHIVSKKKKKLLLFISDLIQTMYNVHRISIFKILIKFKQFKNCNFDWYYIILF